MCKRKVVHINSNLNGWYIGRKKSSMHFGNPFTIGHDGSREKVIIKFERWIRGNDFANIEQDRRTWIICNLKLIAESGLDVYQTLICFCAPQACHGDVYIKLLEKLESGDTI